MTAHNDDTIYAMTIRQQQEAPMKPANLTAYKAVYPEYVDIQDSTRKWAIYTFDGVTTAAVCELANGTIVRLCDVIAEETDDLWFDHMTVVSLSYLNQGRDGPIQMFQNIRAMIAHDLAEDEKARTAHLRRNDPGDPMGTPTTPVQSRAVNGMVSKEWEAFEAKHPTYADDMAEALSLGSELMSITWPEIVEMIFRYEAKR